MRIMTENIGVHTDHASNKVRRMARKILIMGLPGAGKTTLAGKRYPFLSTASNSPADGRTPH
jgi:signal recognition particle GTPase